MQVGNHLFCCTLPEIQINGYEKCGDVCNSIICSSMHRITQRIDNDNIALLQIFLLQSLQITDSDVIAIQKPLQMSHPHRHHFCKIHNLLINNGNHSDNKDSKNKRNSDIYEHDGKLLRNMLLQAVNQRLQQKGNDNPHQDRQTAFININNPIIQLQLLQQ